jgi:signal transduction histidine kinase
MDNFSMIEFSEEYDFDEALRSQESKIRLIIENLISNAIKYIDPDELRPKVDIKTYKDGDKFIFEISDNGLGIPAKHQSEIFTMFKRFHAKSSSGSGLGLYMVKKSVLKLNGSIEFKDLDKGSCFRVIIPIS